MELMTVNEEANYIVQLFVDGSWKTLTEEYSASAAATLMSNAHILTKLNSRFLSKRSDNMVIGECAVENNTKHCPRCESSDYSTSHRCNECSCHFD